jgi:peptidyl-prolyl cis-trans isomerase C
MKKVCLMLLGIFFILSFVACEKIFPPKTDKTETKEEIKINDWAIGLDDFKNYLNSLKPLAEKNKLNIESPEFKLRFLSDLVKAQILSQIAIERGLDKNEDIVRTLRDTRDTLLAAKVRDDLEKNITVSYTEVKQTYDKYKDSFKKPEEVKIREIVVNSESQAKDIYIEILKGADFATLAKQYSIAESKDKGGDRGWLTPTIEDIQKNKKFWGAIATLEKGNTSNIFKGDDGNYYIVKIEDTRGGQDIPLSEVQSKLEESLKQKKLEDAENALIDKFKEKARVSISEDLIK